MVKRCVDYVVEVAKLIGGQCHYVEGGTVVEDLRSLQLSSADGVICRKREDK